MDKRLGETVLQALGERLKGKTLVCGICGGTRWRVSALNNVPAQEHIAGQVSGGPVASLAIVVCEVCGQTLQFNLMVLLGQEKIEAIKRDQVAENIINQVVPNG